MTATQNNTEVKKENWLINLVITVLAFLGFASARYLFETAKVYAAAVDAKEKVIEVTKDLCLTNQEELDKQTQAITRIENSVAELLLKMKTLAEKPVQAVKLPKPEPKPEKKLDKRIIYFEPSSRCVNGRCR